MSTRRAFCGARAAMAITTPSARATPTMRIYLVIGDTTLIATLEDSPTARDFAALLPLRLPLEDYAATEKIATLPRKLSTAGAPPGITPKTGDLCYYAPWGNLAIFHKDFRHSTGLILLGRIEGGIDALRLPGPTAVPNETAAR